MMQNEFLQNRLSRWEQVWGWRYFLFHIAFLPSLLTLLPAAFSRSTVNFLFFSINFIAALVIFRRFLRKNLDINGMQLLKILGVGAAFFALYQLSSAAVGWLFTLLKPDFYNANDHGVIQMAGENYTLMLLGTVVFVPIAEESLHRGLVFRGLYDRSPIAAWLLSTALFSFVHIMNYIGSSDPLTLLLCYLQYIPAGLCLAAAYRLSGTLLCPVLIHAAVNAASMFALR